MKGHGKSNKDNKFENPCWINNCHHSRKKKRTWKDYINRKVKPKKV